MSDFEAFYRENLRLVHAMSLARAVDESEAEDMTQDTFLRAWRCFRQLSGLAPPARRAWLIQTLRNLSTDAWRRRSLVKSVQQDGSSSTCEVSEQSALRLDVLRALANLKEADRELVLLRYLLEMNSREIGELLEMPEGTVRRKLSEARKQLAERLSQWQTK